MLLDDICEIVSRSNYEHREIYKVCELVLDRLLKEVGAKNGLLSRIHHDRIEWYAIRYGGGESKFVAKHYQDQRNMMNLDGSFFNNIITPLHQHGRLIKNSSSDVPPGHPPIENFAALWIENSVIQGMVAFGNSETDFTDEILDQIVPVLPILKILLSQDTQIAQLETDLKPNSLRLTIKQDGQIIYARHGSDCQTVFEEGKMMTDYISTDDFTRMSQILAEADSRQNFLMLDPVVDGHPLSVCLNFSSFGLGDARRTKLTGKMVTDTDCSIPPTISEAHGDYDGTFKVVADHRKKKFIMLNQHWVDVFGYSLGEFRERLFLDFIHPDDQLTTREKMEEMLKDNSSAINFKNRYIGKNGQIIWLLWRAFMINGLTVATAIDITKEMQLLEEMQYLNSELERACQDRDYFLSRASHEIRTPLNAISGFIRLIKMNHNKNLSAQKIDYYCDKIINASGNLLKISDDIINISNMNHDKYLLSYTVHRLVDPLTEVLQNFKKPITDSKLFVFLNHAHLLSEVKVDIDLLKKVLTQLISNAIKFNHPNGEIDFYTTIDHEAATIDLHIVDTGIGVPKKDQPKLFTSFFKGSNTGLIEGTGLGISFSQRAIQTLGGRVSYRDADSGGADFIVTLPLNKPVTSLVDRREYLKLTDSRVLLMLTDLDDDVVMFDSVIDDYATQIISSDKTDIILDIIYTLPPAMMICAADQPSIDLLDFLDRYLERYHELHIPLVVLFASKNSIFISRIARYTQKYPQINMFFKPLNITDIIKLYDTYLKGA